VPTLLTDDEYKATMDPEPVRIGLDEAPPFDFWPYLDSITQEDLADHDFSDGHVAHAWQMSGGQYQHVLVACESPNVFLVLVLDLHVLAVLGHHILDLNRLYGLA
jgi:hypothetical protein